MAEQTLRRFVILGTYIVAARPNGDVTPASQVAARIDSSDFVAPAVALVAQANAAISLLTALKGVLPYARNRAEMMRSRGHDDPLLLKANAAVDAAVDAIAEAGTIIAAGVPLALSALRAAERFIAGFEGDETQEGIPELLALIRLAKGKA